MRQVVTFVELSNDVDTTGTGPMRVVASRVAISYVQHRFRTQYGRQPPIWKSMRFWDNKLRNIVGNLLRVKSLGKTQISEENLSCIREVYQRCPLKSTRAASLQLRTNSTFNSA
jgi:hypothetical protein